MTPTHLDRSPLKRLTKACTVKITGPNDDILGTGFFITPRKLATCRHVLYDDATRAWLTASFRLDGVEGEFALRDDNTKYFPDLDLLVVDLGRDVATRCVNLNAAASSRAEQKLWAWTYNRLYPGGAGIVPVLKEEAVHNGHSVFRISLDAIHPGSSGTPVLNADTAEFFGVVYWMKAPSDDALILPAGLFARHFEDAYRENQAHHHSSDGYWETAKRESRSRSARRLTIVPRISNREVIGRGDDLAQLRRKLADSSQLLLMNGVGGIGKTTLAKLYVHNYEDEYDRLVWIEVKKSLAQSVAGDAALLGALDIRKEQGETPDDLLRRALLALQNQDGKNLMVLDNADDAVCRVKDWLPSDRHWDILLTSRQTFGDFAVYELGKLSQEAAMELFRRHCPDKPQSDEDLAAFLQKLDYHTLSIELFAKTLAHHPEIRAVKELANYFDKRALDDPRLRIDIYVPHAGEETQLYRHLQWAFDLSGIASDADLMLTLKQIAALPPSAEGYPIADLMAWLKVEQERKAPFANRVRRLRQLGWLTQSGSDQRFGCHRLIRTAVAHLQPASAADLMPLVETFTEKLSIDQTKDNPIDKFPWIPYGLELLQALSKEDFLEKARLQNNLGLVLQALGDYAGAKGLLEKALKSAERNFGPDHPTTAVSYSNLGVVLAEMGELAEARRLLEKAHRVFARQLGEQHPHTQIVAGLLRQLDDLADSVEP